MKNWCNMKPNKPVNQSIVKAKQKTGRVNTSVHKKHKINLKRPLKDAKKGFSITVLDISCPSASLHSIHSQQEGRQLEDHFGSYTQETLIDVTQIIHMNSVEAKSDDDHVPVKLSTSTSLNLSVRQSLSKKIVDSYHLPLSEDNFVYANSKDIHAAQPYTQSVESEDQALFDKPLPQIAPSEHSVSDFKSASNDVLSNLSSPKPFSPFVPYKSDKIGRHKVVECGLTEEGNQLKLVVEPEFEDKTVKRECILRDLWLNTKVQVGDTVHIDAIWYEVCDENYEPVQLAVIDGRSGLIVISPDLLVSGTSVVSSVFCRRKAVLSERFRKSDPANRVMLTGTLVHRLFQKALKENRYDKASLNAILQSLLTSPSTLESLYYGNLSANDIKNGVKVFIPKIISFIERYITRERKIPPALTPSQQFDGTIDAICDIEENLWSPRLGLKGKVDLSVVINDVKVPLELKTGKSSFSPQHKGQVSLYSMMMGNAEPTKESNGLLLYISDGAMQNVSTGIKEKQGLVQLRNEMVRYWNSPISTDGQVSLPPRINRFESCVTCPLRTECTLYGVAEEGPNIQNSEWIAHLSPSHQSYFLNWSKMLRFEWEEDRKKFRPLSEIWNIRPRQREAAGYCLSYLQVEASTSTQQRGIDLHELTMQLGLKDGSRLPKTFLQAGDHVILSTDERVAVATGSIVKINPVSVSVTVDHRLPDANLEEVHVDQIGYQGDQSALYSNLSRLMADDPRALNLRNLVIDRREPQFRKHIPGPLMKKIDTPAGLSILKPLNHLQQLAVITALTCKDYTLIEGLPGTGKTSLIVALIRLAVVCGLSVLLTSFTHSAVDNVLIKLLKEDFNSFIRLGRQHRIHQSIMRFSAELKSQHCQTEEDIALVYSVPVVATTCLGVSGHPALVNRQFDLCVVDEAAQALQLAVIGPLLGAKRFVLVGDPRQLPPIVSSRTAKTMGMGVSLFEHLCKVLPAKVVRLRQQYRMSSPINSLANKLSYSGDLQCGNSFIEKATWMDQLPLHSSLPRWLLSVIDPGLVQAIVFIDTTLVCAYSHDQCVNNREANLALLIVAAMAQNGLTQEQMGVIAPYQLQVKHFRRLTRDVYPELEINTVDQYQGRDKSVIIYSCTKSVPWNEGSSSNDSEEDETTGTILHDLRRLTVAVTRARHKLIIIGNAQTLNRYSPFSKLLAALEPHQRYQLCPGYGGFQSSHIDDDAITQMLNPQLISQFLK